MSKTSEAIINYHQKQKQKRYLIEYRRFIADGDKLYTNLDKPGWSEWSLFDSFSHESQRDLIYKNLQKKYCEKNRVQYPWFEKFEYRKIDKNKV